LYTQHLHSTSFCAHTAYLPSFPTRRSSDLAQRSYDIATLAGKVASVNGTAGLQIRFSNLIEQEATDTSAAPAATAITPAFVLSRDRKSTRLNSSHRTISYAVFCLKKKKIRE